jgi:hypothetical protein
VQRIGSIATARFGPDNSTRSHVTSNGPNRERDAALASRLADYSSGRRDTLPRVDGSPRLDALVAYGRRGVELRRRLDRSTSRRSLQARHDRPAGNTYVAVGVYREVQRPVRLVFTWDWENPTNRVGETLVSVEFKVLGEKRTEIVLTHEGFADSARMGRHEQGWTELLSLLEGFIVEHS